MADTDKKNKKQVKHFIDTNPVEAVRSIGSGMAKSMVNDVAKGAMHDWWNQVLGKGTYSETEKQLKKTAGDLSEGEELSLTETKKQTHVEPAINYKREILHGEKRIQQENSRSIEVQIREIIVELKKLTNASKELQVQFKEVTVEQLPVNPGKYHMTFFEWLLSTIKLARMRVEESANWLSLFSSKKKKRQYWNMFKKHGTTFGLSNERVVATQTG